MGRDKIDRRKIVKIIFLLVLTIVIFIFSFTEYKSLNKKINQYNYISNHLKNVMYIDKSNTCIFVIDEPNGAKINNINEEIKKINNDYLVHFYQYYISNNNLFIDLNKEINNYLNFEVIDGKIIDLNKEYFINDIIPIMVTKDSNLNIGDEITEQFVVNENVFKIKFKVECVIENNMFVPFQYDSYLEFHNEYNYIFTPNITEIYGYEVKENNENKYTNAYIVCNKEDKSEVTTIVLKYGYIYENSYLFTNGLSYRMYYKENRMYTYTYLFTLIFTNVVVSCSVLIFIFKEYKKIKNLREKIDD